MGDDQGERGGALVDLAALDADPAVLDHVDPAEPRGARRSGRSRRSSSTSGVGSPSSATGTPASKPTDHLAGSVASGPVRVKTSSGGATHGSSIAPHSMARPQRFSSIEYDLLLGHLDRDVPLLRVLDRLLAGPVPTPGPGRRSRARGRGPACPTSKRTWSLPLPVQPWATAVAPCSARLVRRGATRSPGARAPRRAGTCPRRGRWPGGPARRSPRRTRPGRRRRPPRPRRRRGRGSRIVLEVRRPGRRRRRRRRPRIRARLRASGPRPTCRVRRE